MSHRLYQLALLVCLGASLARAQDTLPIPVEQERWNLYYQATSIGQYHGSFPALYSGPLSLSDKPERDVSLTTTLFFGLRITDNTQFYFDPEIAGGRGFSNVDGLANPTNGELPRVATATPKPYLARLYLTHDFGFGSEKEAVESDANQLSGSRPMTRYTITAGRFSLTDFFDNNAYTHDPRTQFMGWAVMYNGAWDYPADTRGYTWGWVHEFHTRNWSLRYASAADVENRQRRTLRPPAVRRPRRRIRRRATLQDPLRIQAQCVSLEYANHYDGGNYGAGPAACRRHSHHARHQQHPAASALSNTASASTRIRRSLTALACSCVSAGMTARLSRSNSPPSIALPARGLSYTGARWKRPRRRCWHANSPSPAFRPSMLSIWNAADSTFSSAMAI